MKKDILQLLQITATAYETLVIKHYHEWCAFQSMDDADCQKLLSSPSLFRWWYSQYRALEFKFVRRAIEFFGKADPQVMRDFHAETVSHIAYFYSKPLMRVARTHKPVTSQHN